MTKDEITTRVEWMTRSLVELSQPVLVYNDGFKDGANFVLQNLQQCNVSGSLPGWAAELLTEVRFRLLVDIDTDGEPRSSMAELLEMWDKVNKALDIKTIGQ